MLKGTAQIIQLFPSEEESNETVAIDPLLDLPKVYVVLMVDKLITRDHPFPTKEVITVCSSLRRAEEWRDAQDYEHEIEYEIEEHFLDGYPKFFE